MSIAAAAASFVTGSCPITSSSQRAEVVELFHAYERRVFAQTNQLFWWLFIAQWVFGVGVALLWSPLAWEGAESSVHPHLLAAIFLGAVLVGPPLALIRLAPYHTATRHAVAFAQVSFSALLIHLTGGRIETHFHVFGSLAFLALYRDWRVLLTATLVVALDHLCRGIWYPSSVYGVPFATPWRTVEHSLWVIFEDVVLGWACFVSRREMWEICRRENQDRLFRDSLEQRVQERTAELGRSEDRYRALVGNMPIGIFETTRAGEVRVANPYLLSLIGLPQDQDLANLVIADGRYFPAGDRERFWTQLEKDGRVRDFAATFHRTDGTAIDVVINARYKPAVDGAEASCEGTLEDITERKRTARERETLHQQLVIASRQAGMADVATGVLHNVGNVLTSVNIIIHDMLERLDQSRLSHLHRVVAKLEAERSRLPAFLTEDPAGQKLPEFLGKLDTHLAGENARLRADIETLTRHFEHIREVIVTQQSSARLFGVSENLAASQLFEDALKLGADSVKRHGITVVQEFESVPPVNADRHKVLQILVNLLKNAKDSVLAAKVSSPTITARVRAAGPDQVALIVADNGVGIAPENVTRIFQHGFTTKKDGHGFGLHSCVLAAREMHGDLAVASDGVGRGARFILTLPTTPALIAS